MNNFLAAFLGTGAAMAAAFGWGSLLWRAAGIRKAPAPFYTVAGGLSALIFIGGCLNVVRGISAVSLALLGALGLAAWLWNAALRWKACRRRRRTMPGAATGGYLDEDRVLGLVYLLVVLAVGIFLLARLAPSASFNFHDDLQKYIPRPVRMLQTGTLERNPFDAVGLDSLGTQSYLHTFILALASAAYLNLFDDVFCLLLAAGLFFELARRWKTGRAWPLLLLAGLLLINPQDVNISALYSGTVMILALLLSLDRVAHILQSGDAGPGWRRLAPSAAFCGCLLCLKLSLAPFACLWAAVFWTLAALRVRSFRRVLPAAARFFCLAVLFVLPWIAGPAIRYLANPGAVVAFPAREASGLLYGKALPSALDNVAGLFSNEPLFFGGTALAYTLCALIVLAGALFAMRRGKAAGGPAFIAACLSCVCCYFGFALVMPHHLGIRYATPMLIALFPAALVLLLNMGLTSASQGRSGNLLLGARAALILLGLGCLGILWDFAPILAERANRIAAYRTQLAFPAAVSRAYLDYQRHAFSRQKERQIRQIQQRTAENSTLLVYIATPFHLDFKRNRILAVGDVSGLTASRLDFPLGADLPAFRAYLQQKGIRYVWWQYRGLSMRTPQAFEALAASPYLGRRLIGLYGKYLLQMLTQLSRRSAIVFRNDEMVVFEL